ncbi:MAG TPA: hydroxyacylglutathione hydrolase, partial [Gammaproteobacteria bacterium]|nr:hydroxyacylglutathione hydrolase [Gammaproteobacteria bacterium]
DLARQYAMPVYAPAAERIPGATRALSDGDTVAVPGFPVFQVLGVPGHTPGHIAFLSDNALFCGDTLFGGGCGRLLGGTAAQLHASLLRLAGLPDETLIYCAHEYTLDNLRFALNVEPANAALQTRLERDTQRRRAGLPTLPSSLGEEKRTNPFLRCHRPAVAAAASAHAGRQLDTPAEVFAALRRWKDHWHGQSA